MQSQIIKESWNFGAEVVERKMELILQSDWSIASQLFQGYVCMLSDRQVKVTERFYSHSSKQKS